MTEGTDTPLPPQLDGEPDLNAEIARLDESFQTLRDEIKALDKDTDYTNLIERLDALIPEDQRTDPPENASAIDRVFHKITTALAVAKRPAVPVTDTTRASLETPAEDFSSLPPHARMARGYGA